MKQALLQATGQIVIQQVDDLPVGPDDILIRVAYTGVCGSDLHSFRGTHPFRSAPVVLGHEVSGTIAALGAQVSGFALGDAVTVMPFVPCGPCRYCRQGRPNICENKVVPGSAWRGTFAEFFLSKPSATFRLPEHTDLRRAVLSEPLAVGVHSAARARLHAESQALVLGGGTIGILTAAAAHLAGARSVALTDLYEHNLAAARNLGAAHTYSALTPNLVEAIRADYPEGFDAIFLTSGANVTIQQALALAQRGARIIVSAFFVQEVTLSLLTVTIHELEFLGSQIYTAADFEQALAYLQDYPLPFEQIISHVLPLDRAQAALEMMDRRTEDSIKVLLVP